MKYSAVFSSGVWLASLALLVGLATLGPLTAAKAQDSYLSAASDIPLPPQLQETSEAALVFDKPQGRIVQMSAGYTSKKPKPQSVVAFYRSILPNLGWRDESASDTRLTFKRESEMLQVTMAGELVIFDLTPIP
ncbi:hypothetical protein OAI46_05635 [Alphaproteobacteria bacterium]|nr:hypothetical protein [Alphaproteobacteria bacterium]MDC0148325.1 hypothetical protein [Alphaproteobacteria bacterium]